jgi:hypothetical protein
VRAEPPHESDDVGLSSLFFHTVDKKNKTVKDTQQQQQLAQQHEQQQQQQQRTFTTALQTEPNKSSENLGPSKVATL